MPKQEASQEARERLAVVEAGLRNHLVDCDQRAKDNTREHGEIKELIVAASKKAQDDYIRVVSRIWWLVGAALLASGSIILVMYQSIEGGS